MMRSMIRVAAILVAGTMAAHAADSASDSPMNPAEHTQALNLLNYFTSFCIEAYPVDQAVRNAVKMAGFKPASDMEKAAILDKESGDSWSIVKDDATYIVAMTTPPTNICSVATNLEQHGDAVEAVFTTVVSGVLSSVDKGGLAPAQTIERAAPAGGSVKMLVSPLNSQDTLPQIFVNVYLTQPGHASQTRFMRVFTQPRK